jgi:hypothetical protein
VKLTGLDWIVLTILAMMLATHFMTAFAVEYYKTCGEVQASAMEVTRVIESVPLAKYYLAVRSWGIAVKIIAVAALYALWFGFIRKYQKWPTLGDAVRYTVLTIFFFSLWATVNDLGHFLGLIM